VSKERQQSVNEFGCGILYNPRALLRHLPIIEVLAVCIGNIRNVDVATPENERQQRVNRASTILSVASRIIQGRYYSIYP